jgi:hypothetical protein
MKVSQLEKGMLLVTSGSLSFNTENSELFAETSNKNFPARAWPFTWRLEILRRNALKLSIPFTYLGSRKIKNKYGKYSLIREILCSQGIFRIWGYDFRYLEPLN